MNTTPPTGPTTDPPPSAAPLVKGLPSTRSLVALITAIAGLVAAIASFQRTPDEPTAKESYVVLQKAFLEQQIEVDGLKKDVLSMRASFEAYARAKEGDTNVVQSNAPAPPGAIPPVEVHVRPTPSTAFSSATPAASHVVVIPSARAAAPSRPALPSVHDLESNARAKK